MIFKTYEPTTSSERSAIGVATVKYNAVCRFCGKNKPNKNDYIEYKRKHSDMGTFLASLLDDDEEGIELINSWTQEWYDILDTIRSNDSSPIFAVYIAILPSGVKCGETKNLRQRYSSLKASNDILHMYYLPVENKEQSTAAEDALHYIFDHAKGMRREKNKKDYYSCDEDYARKFIERNKREIYDAIMAEIEGD
jgi:hypothetical protein